MMITSLNGKWKMRELGTTKWFDTTVPGSVYLDLLNNNLMEDPFWGDNELRSLEISKKDFEYRRIFVIEEIDASHVFLNCEGLDTLCEVYLNEQKILDSDNMHCRYNINITNVIKKGNNSIRILIKSPTKFVLEKNKEQFLTSCADAVPGISHIRKAHYMFGWDWGPKLPDSGIWRDIYITGYVWGKLEDVMISQHGTDKQWEVLVDTEVTNFSQDEYTIQYTLTAPNGEVQYKGENKKIIVDNPKLWYPRTMGEQPLYTLSVSLLYHSITADIKTLTIGLRTIRLVREPDEWGESFAFEINGQTFFAMGANYIPEDNLLSRRSKERSEKLIRSCIEANFNMLRIWGGGYYPDDWFYDLCDQYGILVWQDHLYACGAYSFSEKFKQNITAETIDNVRRIRHHPSLCLWSGNNELEYAWAYWRWEEAYGNDLKQDYIRQFEEYLPELTHSFDPNTDYITSSPTARGGFDDPNQENIGDMHYWEVWHGRKPLSEYRKLFPRFMSEFGLQSFSSVKTVSTFTTPQEQNIFSYTMEQHQKNGTGNEKILYYISQYFKYPNNFQSLVFLSQLVQAEGVRIGVEHWRRHRGRCMGALYWQLNDCWPGASWSSIDYFGRWKALHYFARIFFNPILLGAVEDDNRVHIFISNETSNMVAETVTWQLRDFSDKIILSGECKGDIAPFTSADIASVLIPDMDYSQKRKAYFTYKYESQTEYKVLFFAPYKHLELTEPSIEYRVAEEDGRTQIQLLTNTVTPFVTIETKHSEAIFSDNYFHLVPGITKTISAEGSVPNSDISVKSLYDSFS